MKNKVLTLMLTVVGVATAQNVDFLKNLNSINSKESAIRVSEDIASASENKLRFFKAKDFADDHALLVRFVPATLTDQEYNAMPSAAQEGFLTVKFDVSGTDQKLYKFKQVTGSFQQILPFWQRSFRPDADAARTPKDAKLQRLIDREKKLDYYFQEDDEGWILRNQS